MKLTDDQKNELSLWLHYKADDIGQLFELIEDWLEAEAESSFEAGRGDGYEDGYTEGEQAALNGHEPNRLLGRFEARQAGPWWRLYDAVRQEHLPTDYNAYQAKTLAADLNRRWRDG